MSVIEKDPKLAVTNPQLLKQVKVGAGIRTDVELNPAFVPVNVVVQVQNIFERGQQPQQVEAIDVDSEPEKNG